MYWGPVDGDAHSKCLVMVMGQYDTIGLFKVSWRLTSGLLCVCVWRTGQKFCSVYL